MSCAEIRAELDDFLNGRLGGTQSLRIRGHLATCANCRALLRGADQVEILPALDETVEPSPNAEARFHAKLLAHRAENAGRRCFSRDALRYALPGTWAGRLVALGVLAGFLVAGTYLGFHRASEPGAASIPADIPIAQNLPLLQDMGVITNLDLLEDFDDIERLSTYATASPVGQ